MPSTLGRVWPMSMMDTESAVRVEGASPGRSCLPSLADTAIWARAGIGSSSAVQSKKVFMGVALLWFVRAQALKARRRRTIVPRRPQF